MAKFESKEEYNQWCEDIISKIYYSNIAMNNEGIKEAVMEIASKLHIPEGECLFDGAEIGSTCSPVYETQMQIQTLHHLDLL